MSGYPIVLDGGSIEAVIVGGGRVAERKARSLLAAGARVRMVAPEFSQAVRALATSAPEAGAGGGGGGSCLLIQRRYERGGGDLAAATLVVAATDSHAVNARVAVDARSRGQLVNVADDPEAGNFITPAVHRGGDLTIAVSAGGVPGISKRVRDELAARFDDRYADAVRALGVLRRRLLEAGDREGWDRATAALIGQSFCERVESGTLAEEAESWR